MRRVVLAAAVGLTAAPAVGQVMGGQGRPTLLENARIVTGDGEVIESGSILIRQGRVVAVGAVAPPLAPENARRVDLAGRTVTPGFIDGWGALGMTESASGGGPTHDVLDGLNPYADDDFTDALRSGLTTVALPARSGNGVQGQGVVIRLVRDRTGVATEPVEDSRLLCIDLASGAGATSRLSLFDGLRKQFRDAVEYRKAVELYEEELLPEYIRKIEERAKEKEEGENEEDAGEADDAADEDGAGGDEGAERPPGRRGRGGGSRGGGAADDDPGAVGASGDSDSAQDPEIQSPPRPARGGRGGPGRGRGQQGRGGQQGNGDEIEKPEKPRRNPDAEVLLKAVDQELPVAVTADGSADILNAIELAEEFGLSIVIVGGAEAHTVAPLLAEADVPVILNPEVYGKNLAANIHALESTGVTWAIGAGAGPARGLLPAAQLIAAAGNINAIELLTTRAAAALRLGDDAGRIAPDGAADLVVWSGDPLDPSSRVETVYVNGRTVYEAPTAGDQQQGDAP